MTDFEEAWILTRTRFCDAVKELNQEQLNWRIHPDTLTCGESALHVAGAEVRFAADLLKQVPEGLSFRLYDSAANGVVNDLPFPFSASEITPKLVAEALETGKQNMGPLIANPDDYRDCEVVTILGPTVNGTGVFARMAYHAGYHQGQVHLLKTAPGFPKN
jgi:hypothetical protein